jgi:hypothetical protein
MQRRTAVSYLHALNSGMFPKMIIVGSDGKTTHRQRRGSICYQYEAMVLQLKQMVHGEFVIYRLVSQ